MKNNYTRSEVIELLMCIIEDHVSYVPEEERAEFVLQELNGFDEREAERDSEEAEKQ